MGLWNGIANGIGAKKRGISWSSYWATLYKERVEIDGGTVIDETGVRRDMKAVDDTGEFDSLVLGLTTNAGFKIEKTNGYKGVKKWYDLSQVNNDAAQDTPANQPHFYGSFGFQKNNEVLFGYDEAIGFKYLTHPAILNGNFTSFYVIRYMAGQDFLHAGSVAANKTSIWLAISGYGVAPALYQGATPNVRGANPVAMKNVVMTFQPSHIYRNGEELAYKAGYTADVQGIGFTTIGIRPDDISAGYSLQGEVAAIFVYDKILDDTKRAAFENYLISEYCDTDYSGVNKLSSYSQLSYQILSQLGDKILAIDRSASPFQLKYSANAGLSFTNYSLGGGNCLQGHIFGSGRLFVVLADNKAYKSDDALATLTAITMYDEAGDEITAVNSAPPLQNKAVAMYGTDEIISWGSYGSGTNMILYSKNGDYLKVSLRIGAAETIKGDHFHWVVYSQTQTKWYAHTGDSTTDHEVHWFEGVYDNDLNTWVWTELYEGDIVLGQLTTGAVDVGDYLYFVTDMTLGNSYSGVWRVPYAGIDDPANFERIYTLPYEFGFIYFDQSVNKIIQVVYHTNDKWGHTRKWEVFVYDITADTISRYWYDGTDPAYPNEGGVSRYQYNLRKYGEWYYLDYLVSGTPNKGTLKFQI